jgi:hypothetical protein
MPAKDKYYDSKKKLNFVFKETVYQSDSKTQNINL